MLIMRFRDNLIIAYQVSKKTRRGLINGLETIAKTLFKTMDAGDERIITEQLNLLQENQQRYST